MVMVFELTVLRNGLVVTTSCKRGLQVDLRGKNAVNEKMINKTDRSSVGLALSLTVNLRPFNVGVV